LPALPELPRRSGSDTLIGLVAAGLDGVSIADGGALRVDRASVAVSGNGPVADATLVAFCDAITGRSEPVKWQRCGPLTLALALVEGGAAPQDALVIAIAAVRSQLALVQSAVAAVAPDATQVAVLDEPGLTALGHPSFPWSADEVIDAVSTCLADLEARGCTTGVHSCGTVDWAVVSEAGPSILFAPVGGTLGANAACVSRHLELGGVIAWGVVPTSRPLGESADRLWHMLAAEWCELVGAGCDPLQLRQQAMVTPECGLAFHDPEQVAPIFGLAASIGERVHSQALGARFTLGA
jgi:hypothetical protein